MQKEPNRFPGELLSQPWSARHAYFRDYCTVRHPKLMEAFAELDHFVRRPSERRIIGLVGPTGAGKTKLKVMLVKAVIERLLPELTVDPGRVPIATFSIWGPEVDAFSWRDLYHCYLESMDEVLITHKIARVRKTSKLTKGTRTKRSPLLPSVQHLDTDCRRRTISGGRSKIRSGTAVPRSQLLTRDST